MVNLIITVFAGVIGTCFIGGVVRECNALDMSVAAHDIVLIRGNYTTFSTHSLVAFEIEIRKTVVYFYIFFLYSSCWTASSEFGTYRLCEQRRFRRTCASAQSRQNLRYSIIQAVNQEEPSDRKPDPWPL